MLTRAPSASSGYGFWRDQAALARPGCRNGAPTELHTHAQLHSSSNETEFHFAVSRLGALDENMGCEQTYCNSAVHVVSAAITVMEAMRYQLRPGSLRASDDGIRSTVNLIVSRYVRIACIPSVCSIRAVHKSYKPTAHLPFA